MYTREEFATKIFKHENGGEFLLKYYLTSKESEMESAGTMIYGIEIEKYAVNDAGEPSFSERVAVTNLSCNSENVRDVIEKVSLNLTTPVSLVNVLDDISA